MLIPHVHLVTRILVLLLLFLGSVALGQTIPRAGTRFTFAIPEGADNVSILTTPSKIVLNVLSPHDGEGVIWSPSGTTLPFTFKANQPQAINLPYSLATVKELGKSDHGIIVRTTQPVNLTLHNILSFAGEATQIWPDAALDTKYLVPGWGLWNDPIGENNRSQITVVASENNTSVTVTPSVDCIGGERKGVPSTMILQRGECYIIKADTTGIPVQFSLFRSSVSSDKPVSVLTSTTCAYAPLATQACNEILDHILPYKNVGTEFNISTPSAVGHKCRVLFISETTSFFVFTSGGATAIASNGRAELSLTQPTQFTASVPVQCYLVTDGSNSYYLSDPSIVTVLPSSEYANDLYWYSPRIFSETNELVNFVSVIYPTANENEVLLDNNAVGLYPNKAQIPNTPMSAAMIAINEGVHRITSPVPVLGTAYGFLPADAYSFAIMGKGPRIDIDTPDFSVHADFTDPKTCEVFSGIVSLNNGFEATEDVHRFRLTLTYDFTAVELVDVDPIGMLASLDVTLDTSTPGVITVYVISDPTPIIGSGDLLSIKLYGKRAGPTTLTSKMSASQLEFVHLEVATFERTEIFTLDQTRYQGQVQLSVLIEDVTVGEPTLAHVVLNDAINGSYNEVRIHLAYDHDLLEFIDIVDPNTKLLGWNYARRQINFETDEFVFTPNGQPVLQGNGTLMRFRFKTFVSKYDTTTVRAWSSLTSQDPCPLDLNGLQGERLFRAEDTCSTPTIRNMLKSVPLEFLDVTPNPTTGAVDAHFRHLLSVGDPIGVTLSDLTGKSLWKTSSIIATAPEAHLAINFPTWLGSGTYTFSLEAAGYTASRQVVIAR